MNTINTNHWNQIEFSQFVTLKRGQDLTKSAFKNGNIPVAGSNGVIGFHDKANYSGPGVTVGRSGSCGMVQYYENDFWAHNTVLVVADFKCNHPKFVNYYLQFLKLEQFATGASVPTLNRNLFSNLLVNDVSYNEQEQIAFVLSTLQKAIQKQEEIVNTTKALKKSLLNKLFTEGTKGEPLKETDIGMIPESWEVEKLGGIVNFTTGKLNSNAAVKNGKYPFFTCSQETFTIDSYAFDQEALLLSGNNASAIYSVKYYKGKFNAYQRTYVITIKDLEEYSYTYLKHLLSFKLEELRHISIGSSTKYLTLGLLTNLQMPKPEYKEQMQIGNSLDAIDKKLFFHYRKKMIYESLFNTLLNDLMTGSIRVHDIDFYSKLTSAAKEEASPKTVTR